MRRKSLSTNEYYSSHLVRTLARSIPMVSECSFFNDFVNREYLLVVVIETPAAKCLPQTLRRMIPELTIDGKRTNDQEKRRFARWKTKERMTIGKMKKTTSQCRDYRRLCKVGRSDRLAREDCEKQQFPDYDKWTIYISQVELSFSRE